MIGLDPDGSGHLRMPRSSVVALVGIARYGSSRAVGLTERQCGPNLGIG